MALVDGIRKRNIFKEMITILAAAAVVPVTLIIFGVASPPYVESMVESMQESKSALETMWWAMYCVHDCSPGGTGDLVAIYSRSKEESVFFAKYILRRTDAELATLEGE